MKHVGYAGQRYEVSCDKDGQRMIVGWSDDPGGGGLVATVNAHPVWCDPVVRELTPAEIDQLSCEAVTDGQRGTKAGPCS